MVKTTIDTYGKLNILVNNAGLAKHNLIPNIEEQDWDDQIAVNLKGTFLCTQAVFRQMCDQKYGHIVNVSSGAGKVGPPSFGAYSAAKFGVVGLTGLGLKFSSMMLAFSGGNLVLALLLVLLASLILGMGLPVTASYIVLIVLVGPALTAEFGVPLLIAHLVVFWYSQDSNVTPPIALAGFAGAAIAGSKPMETGFQAWKFAKGLYIIPLFMVFNPEIIIGYMVLYLGALKESCKDKHNFSTFLSEIIRS
jgi:hypothetical protein